MFVYLSIVLFLIGYKWNFYILDLPVNIFFGYNPNSFYRQLAIWVHLKAWVTIRPRSPNQIGLPPSLGEPRSPTGSARKCIHMYTSYIYTLHKPKQKPVSHISPFPRDFSELQDPHNHNLKKIRFYPFQSARSTAYVHQPLVWLDYVIWRLVAKLVCWSCYRREWIFLCGICIMPILRLWWLPSIEKLRYEYRTPSNYRSWLFSGGITNMSLNHGDSLIHWVNLRHLPTSNANRILYEPTKLIYCYR